MKIPILKGFIDSTRNPTIKVWCPFCRKFHIHGWPDYEQYKKHPKSNAWQGEHRAAHCHIETPLKKTGYYIKPFGNEENVNRTQ